MAEASHPPKKQPPWRPWAGNFYVQLAAAYLVVAAAMYLRAFPFRSYYSHYGGKIWLTPLHAYWDPRITPWVLPAAVALAASVALIIWAVKTRKTWLALPAAGLAIAAVNAAPGGGRRFPFDWLEHALFDARILFRAPNVFADYVEITRTVSCHCRTRPGLLYWLLGALDRVFANNVYAIETVIIAAAVVSVPLLYYGARAVTKNDAGFAAAALLVCAPALLIFGPGPDGLNCLIGTGVIAMALKAAASERPWLWSAVTGVLLAIAVMTSYLLIILTFFAAAFLLAGAVATGRGRRALASGLIIGITAVAVLAVFQAITGYEHITVFKRAFWANQGLPSAGTNVIKLIAQALGRGGDTPFEPNQRPYGVFVLGNLYATFFIMGVPTAVLYLRELGTVISRRQVRGSLYGATVIVFALVFLAYNFSGLILGEVERVWLFLIPGFVIPAAVQLTRMARGPYGSKALTLALGLGAGQALLYNILLLTVY